MCFAKIRLARFDPRLIIAAFSIAFFALALQPQATRCGNQINGRSLQIPKRNSITIDGTENEEEWKGALREKLIGGGELRLKCDDDNLYIGVRGLKKGWSHVYLTDGESICVAHASTGLGTAIYRKDSNGLWQPSPSFSWAVRDPSQSAEALAARAVFFESNGWVASTNQMGVSTDIEFKVHRKFLKNNDSYVAIIYASDDAKSTSYWPKTIADDCIKQELVLGHSPPNLNFDSTSWAKMELP
jgi:hypothetical protein